MPAQLQEAQKQSTATQKSFRLETTVVPKRYEITIAPDLETHQFSGRETIEVSVRRATGRIVLNAVDITFTEVYAEASDGTRLYGAVEIDRETELAAIVFDGALGCGIWHLKITFKGDLSEQLRGFYRSSWLDQDGEKHTIASTHFEPTHARRAFPCFDEPQFKATFKVFLEVDENLTALSNGRILRETKLSARSRSQLNIEENGGREENGTTKKLVEFAETMLLSTYLVAFAVGEFVGSQRERVNGTEIRIFCVPGKEHLTEFAADCAAFAVDFYERYFEIPYPAEKIDHVAIPDFPIGAMENLGLITFRETALLVDQKQSSHAGLARVAEIIMHELAHMWFGDLVTMEWWNGLWLKESFATFMANICLDAFRPDWKVWNDFALSRADAMETDALKSTHPIENPVNHPDEATEMFDVISYQKGCSVLYQLHEFIGAESFRMGCARYLKQHSFANTETHQLWDSLEEACHDAGLNIPVRRIMDTWVFSSGHPVITVERGALPGCIVLRQGMFRLEEADETAFIWPVPVSIRVTADDGRIETKKFAMFNREEIVFIGENTRSFIVNAMGSGFWRVVYKSDVVSAITEDLQRLSTVERFNLLNDAWSTLRAGQLPVAQYVELVQLYRHETDSSVWQVLYDSLEHLDGLVDSEDKPAMAALIRDLCAPNLAALGWQAQTGEAVETRKLRALVLKLIGVVAEDPVVKRHALEVYQDWRQDNSTLDAELVPTVVHIVALDGDEKLYDDFFRLSQTANTPQDTIRYLYALARFRRKDLLDKTASLCLSPTVRSQDAPYLFAAIIRNPAGAADAWEFLKANFDTMKSRYPDLAIHKMVEALSVLDTPQLETDVRKFFAHNRVKAGETAVRQMLEQLRINVRMRQKEKAALKAALTT
jgi:puromycin-sensitive aminopeptidase